MKLLITGASGFVASQIIPHLQAGGAELLLIGRNAAALKAAYPDCSSGDYNAWDSLANDVDAVVHLAAKNNDKGGEADSFFEANTALLEDTLGKTKASGIPLLIFTSSLHTRPETGAKSDYALSKRAAEDLLSAEIRLPVKIYQLAAVHGEVFAGNLAIITRFPKPLQPLLLQLLAAIRPTLHAKRLADEILNAVADARSEQKILTDEQRGNIVFSFFKRSIDLLFVAAIVVFLFWLIALVWIAVKLTSQGPGIFAQKRVGLHGRAFTCYKFRTMQQGTKQAGTHELSQTCLTPIGAVLRKTKIDEFPQIVNIIKGEMSLIGPRPCLTSQTELIEARRKLGVLDVRPGISGLSQIRNIDMSTPIKLAHSDAEYIALRTIPLELKIIVTTALGGGQGDKTRDA